MKKILAMLLCGILLCGCGAKEDTKTPVESTTENTAGENEGESVEEKYYVKFTAKSVDGEEVTDDIFASSKLTMINVWGTYCNPCLNEMPDLGEIATAYDEADFQIIGIVCDVEDTASEEDIAYVKELIDETKATYLHLLLGEDLYMNLVGGVSAVPTTFFVKNDGEMIGYLTGALSKASWEELINDLLSKVEE